MPRRRNTDRSVSSAKGKLPSRFTGGQWNEEGGKGKKNKEETNGGNALGIYAIARQMLRWSKGNSKRFLSWKRREDCREKGEVTDPSDPAPSSTTMPYLARRIPLRHGTPQIRKAQIPRTPCGFGGGKGSLVPATIKKEGTDAGRSRRLGRRRNEREKEFRGSDVARLEVQFGRLKVHAAKGICYQSMPWIFDISSLSTHKVPVKTAISNVNAVARTAFTEQILRHTVCLLFVSLVSYSIWLIFWYWSVARRDGVAIASASWNLMQTRPFNYRCVMGGGLQLLYIRLRSMAGKFDNNTAHLAEVELLFSWQRFAGACVTDSLSENISGYVCTY